MGFEGRKKGKYAGAEKFVKKMKKIQEEAKAALRKAQEDMRKYADKKRSDADECYESPRGERVSHAFTHLISNIKSYNGVKI